MHGFLLMNIMKICLNGGIIKLLSGSIPATLVHTASVKRCQLANYSTSLASLSGHSEDLPGSSDVVVVANKIRVWNGEEDILSNLMHDESCAVISLNHTLVDSLLCWFKNDWKSALAIFRWAESRSCFELSHETWNMMIDILGKARQFEKMRQLVGEMCVKNIVSIKTVAVMMRRFAGAHQWKDSIRTFDDLGAYGLDKNSESMNVLLDTLCKEKQVEMARDIFLELKSHISPTAYTFNILIHGWCKIKRFEEAYWTLEEMRGHGFLPSVISYSTIIHFYCLQSNWSKAFDLLELMETQGLQPSIVTYTNIMCSLAKAEEYVKALEIADRVRSTGCEPDIMYYNGLINTLGRAGWMKEAFDVFEIDMPKNGVTPNASTYNTLISIFCYHGQEHMAFEIIDGMENSAICKPDLQTFYPLLKACLKFGKSDSFLRRLLDDMVIKHHLSLDDSTYSLLIHGLCRVDRCEWAFHFFEEMMGKELQPRYQTCRLLLDRVKEKNMHEAAERIEQLIKHLKASKKQSF